MTTLQTLEKLYLKKQKQTDEGLLTFTKFSDTAVRSALGLLDTRASNNADTIRETSEGIKGSVPSSPSFKWEAKSNSALHNTAFYI